MLIQSSLDGHLGSLHFVGIADNAGRNIGIQVFVEMYIFNSLRLNCF